MQSGSEIVPLTVEPKVLATVPPRPETLSTNFADGVYDGAIDDLDQWTYAIAFWRLADKAQAEENELARKQKREPNDVLITGGKKVLFEMQAKAYLNQLHATHNLSQLAQRLEVLELWRAQQTGWPAALPASYNSVAAILENMWESASEEGKESERLDLDFICSHLLPAMQHFDIDVDQVIRLPNKFSKARAAVPNLRMLWRDLYTKYQKNTRVLQDEDGTFRWVCGSLGYSGFSTEKAANDDFRRSVFQVLTDQEAEVFSDTLRTVISQITGDTPVREFRKRMALMAGKPIATTRLSGSIYNFPNGQELITVWATPRTSRLVESKLRDIVPDGFMPRDPAMFAHDLLQKLNIEPGRSRYGYDQTTKRFFPNKDGVLLFTDIGMYNRAKIEIGNSISAILTAFDMGLKYWQIMVFSIANTAAHENVIVSVIEGLSLPRQLDDGAVQMVLDDIPTALEALYKKAIKEACADTLPDYITGDMLVCEMVGIGKWGVTITFRRRL